MVKLHVSIATTLDGFITDDDGGMGWIIMGDEWANYMAELVQHTDTLIMGRETYQMFASAWPEMPNNPDASGAEKIIGERFNVMKKVGFSKTLEKADWGGTTILREIAPEDIQQLKEDSEMGIRLDGSASVVQ